MFPTTQSMMSVGLLGLVRQRTILNQVVNTILTFIRTEMMIYFKL